MSQNRRKPFTKKLRAEVALQQNGLCACGCGEKLMPGFHIDHHPPLFSREWDAAANDTVPPANDKRYLFGLIPAHHIAKTNHPRGRHTTVDSDNHAYWKGRRVRGEVKGKPKRDWPSRPMRGTERRAPKDINDL